MKIEKSNKGGVVDAKIKRAREKAKDQLELDLAAIGKASKAEAKKVDSAAIMAMLGIASEYNKKQNEKSAQRVYSRILKIDPGNPEALAKLKSKPKPNPKLPRRT